MMDGGEDFPAIFFQDDKVYSRLPSRGKDYSSKHKESSFRVLYYGGATGSVPFLWESQPGTPKDKFSNGPLPPLTPPPRYQSSPLASPSLRKKHSNIFNSIFARASSKKTSTPPSFSSSYPFQARVRSIVDEDDDDDYEPATNSPTSTLCFRSRNGSSSGRSKACYYPMKSVKKVVMSIVGPRISNY